MRLKEAGVVWTYPNKCSPLDDLKVVFEWNGLKGQRVTFKVSDADHRAYLVQSVTAGNGRANLVIRPAGKPGVHHIEVRTPQPGGRPYLRHGSFRVSASTSLSTDTGEIDELLALLEEGLRQSIDVTCVNGKPRTYYKAADNTFQNLAFPPFAVGALRYFIRDLKSMFEAIYDNQWPSGRLPDHVYGDAYPCPQTPRRIRTCMADLEVGTAWNLCLAWHAHGDDDWLRAILPKVEAAIEYATTDPTMFDQTHGTIKRPHTLDEWDIAFTGNGEHYFTDDRSKFVIMQGDTAQLCYACALLSEAFASIGRTDRAARYRLLRDRYYRLGNRLFWDGVKYRHHIHLDPFDHGGFDEDDQLTMSNAAAITRGLADHRKAVSIINEYVRRWKETGDRFPWWSLQPGYPDELGYFPRHQGEVWSLKKGHYANGGLFPWVGGELCRAAFQHGMEDLAYRLLEDVHYVLKRDNGALFTWYNLDGTAAINAPHNQTNYDPWGLAPWTQAVVEELAGIKPLGKLMNRVLCAPRWPVTKARSVSATAHFPASDAYFSYRYHLSQDRIEIRFGGTGERVSFRILLPKGWRRCRYVTLDGRKTGFKIRRVESSAYVALDAKIEGVREIILAR